MIKKINRVRNGMVNEIEPLKIIEMIDQAVVAYQIEPVCLTRSCSAQYILKKSGITSVLKIGVKLTPFVAHSWVEIENVPLRETENIAQYETIFQLK